METTIGSKENLLRQAAEIVSAYVRGNEVSSDGLPPVIGAVYRVLSELERSTGETLEEALQPAVTIGRSVRRSRIVCLEDGKAFKALKRHLRTAHRLTPDELTTRVQLGNLSVLEKLVEKYA